jgi:radical SAM protein with 4Fe4S-binding SPASM domain
MATYQEEQNILFNSFLDRYCKNAPMVEFIISSSCNQKCEYCYLMKHGKELYPPQYNKKDLILTNFKLLLQYLYDEGYDYTTFNIFSGEFFALPFWEDILQIIYDFKVTHYPDVYREISVPTNGTFIKDEEKTQRVEIWLEKLQKIKCPLYLSFSIDGPNNLEELTRPDHHGNGKSDEFYDNIFKFAKKHDFTFHPMVAADFVRNYKENYDWWIDNIIKYDMYITRPDGKKVLDLPMFLYVRDPYEWDEKNLQSFHDFLLYMAEKNIKDIYHGDIEDFTLGMFGGPQQFLSEHGGIQPDLLDYPSPVHSMSCSIQNGPIWRLGDLALVPCHRTSYENFVFGRLITDEDHTKITGVQAEKPMLAFKVKTLNPNRSTMKCAACKLKSFCSKGCLGSQFENERELFTANDTICEMYKVYYKSIHEVALKYNCYDIVAKSHKINQERKEYIKNVKNVLSTL